MLTADQARVRRQGRELRLVALSASTRARAEQLAANFLQLARNHRGRTRAELEEAWAQAATGPAERKLAAGLQKLVEDRCGFDVVSAADPAALRGELFLAASAALRAAEDGGRFDRQAFIADQARARNLKPEELERALYADLRGEQVLRELKDIAADKLVDQYQAAQAQAVLLRAEKVTAEVNCADPYAYRALFSKLKFLRLLHTIAPLPQGGYRIEIDGPYSLFSSVTKYGLQLALALPALQACDQWELAAQVRWGKSRQSLLFKLQGRSAGEAEPAGASGPHLPDEVQTLLDRFNALDTEWRAEPAADILEVRGAGLCVPDLRFTNRFTGETAYLEVMGFWSREAVWKRVELARRGLPYRIIFAVSSRLRVSESVLDEESSAELYLYRGAMSAREIARRLDRKSG